MYSGLHRIPFYAYTAEQLGVILKQRVEGFEDLFKFTTLILIARKVASATSDARRALDIAQ